MTDYYENDVYQQICKFSIDVVEKQEQMLMKTIQEIGGTRYEHITVDKNKVVQALRNATVQKPEVKWISVKDRLPETKGEYLCADYFKTLDKYFIRVLNFAEDLYKVDKFDFRDEKGKSGFYYFDSEWGGIKVDDVTHWMPLPKPPKKEGVDNG